MGQAEDVGKAQGWLCCKDDSPCPEQVKAVWRVSDGQQMVDAADVRCMPVGATTVMVVGFINAGLMSLAQAMPVILGANIGTTLFRLIAVVTTEGTPRPFTTAIGNELLGTPELSSSWFRQTRVTLALGDTTPFKQATRTVVAILPMSGSVTIEREDGSATVLSTPGAFTVIAAGTRYRLRHESGLSAQVVLVQPH